MKPLAEARVVVVGLGLMGGSLAGALHGKCAEVVGVDCDEAALAGGLAKGFIDRGTTDLEEVLEEAPDIVVLATPVRTIVRLLPTLGPPLPPGCLVMDLGSTKRAVLAAMDELPAHVEVLGGHPMCGKELSGIAAAEATLFQGRTFILSPLPRTSAEALAQGQAVAQAVGARPLVIEGARQDYLVATISHLPYLLACALVSTADATTSADPLVWEILAGGYRDTSRVAGSDVDMMMDILLTNRDQVLQSVQTCAGELAHLAHLLESGAEDALREKLAYIRATRKEMYP